MIRSRLGEALAAIQTVLEGAQAADAESEVVDFKEEAGTVAAGGQRQPIPPNHDPAARALAAEAACLANSQRGGVLIVGVNDKAAGRAAFTGTYLDTLWLRERIHALTQPHLSVDLIQEQQEAGKRIYLIDVAPQLEEIRCDGKLRTRIGRDCQELDGNRARALLEARRRYDWSAEQSGLRLSAADPEAVALARQFYGTSHQRPAPASTAEFASRLGLLAGSPLEEEDPELNRAGALLLCTFEPNTVQIDVQVKRTESVPTTVRLEEPAPLLLAYQRTWDQVQQCFPATPTVVGGLRQSVQAVPERAAREAMVNALMHRDYRQVHNQVLVTVLGNPSQTLKVRSPGGFPLDVSAARLLTTPSRPRNPVLTGAFRILGLAEGEGIGIDTLYIQMLRDGHPTPEITEDGGDVICRLAGGRPDLGVRSFFDGIARLNPNLGEDVRPYIAITLLLHEPVLRPATLALQAQCTLAEAAEVLEALQTVGALERLVNGSRTFRLTVRARTALRERVGYQMRASWEAHWIQIRAYLDVEDQISSPIAAELLNISGVAASNLLSRLAREHDLLEPVGNARGRGVRYRLGPAATEPA